MTDENVDPKKKRVRLPKAQGKVKLDKAVPAAQLRTKKGTFTDEPSKDADGASEVVVHRVRTAVPVHYLVNPGGAVHELTKEDAQQRLGTGKGWRMATKEEIAKYKAAAAQLYDAPIAPRWTPEPELK